MLNNCLTHRSFEGQQTSSPLQIDLPGTMLRKFGERRMRYVPDFAVRVLKKIICVSQMNAMLRTTWPATGPDFARRVLEELNVKTSVTGAHHLPDPSDRRVMFISNHPLGGIEGLALINLMSRHFGGHVYAMVNDILMAVAPLREVFLPVNSIGKQNQDVSVCLEEALASDNPVLIFPAGTVSRLLPGIGIHDIAWRPTFVNLALRHDRKVVPVFCGGRNSMLFYRLGRLREILGIPFHFEMVCTPREVFRQRNSTLPIVIGAPVETSDLRGGPMARRTADELCNRVYSMAGQARI